MIKYVKLLFAIVALSATNAHGLTSGQVTVSNGSGPYFYADDGNCGSSEVPQAAYIVVNVLNTSSTDTLFNVAVKMTSNSNLASGFKLLSHTDDSIYVIPRILPSTSVGAYFYVQYPCTKNLSSTFGFTLSDNNGGAVTFNTSISTQDVGRASAGGDIISQSIAGIDALGILIADTVTYEFGNYNGGEMYFQPSGDTLFPTDELELIGSEVLSSPFSSCSGPTTGDKNTLYYNAGSGCGAGSGNQVKVVYYYISSLFNETANFKPYAGMKSGGPIKYLSNYGTGTALGTFSTTTAANKLTNNKTASCGICTAGDTITYTITIANSSSRDLMFDKILDSLPAGHSYVGFAVGSDITAANASIYPSAGATGNVTFSGLIPEATFPYRSFLVPGNDSISLKYRVKIPGSSSNDLFNNRAIGQVGSVKFDTSFALTCAGCTALPVTLVYFEGHVIGETNVIHWETASETNNQGFDVYRLEDGQDHWLGYTPGAGNTFATQRYAITDYEPIQGTMVYKLVQTDFDGHQTAYYTSVKRLSNETSSSISVFPNPVGNVLTIETDNEDPVVVNIMTVTGEKVITTQMLRHTINIDVDSLPSGTYYVAVKGSNSGTEMFKVIKI